MALARFGYPLAITGITKTQQHRLCGRAEQWPFDDGWHFQHQRGSGIGVVDSGAHLLIQLTPGGATGIQQRFPA